MVRPIGRHLRGVLHAARRLYPDSTACFPGQYSMITPASYIGLANLVRKIRAKHNMEDWTPKDTRRTAATLLQERGIGIETLGRLLNHSHATVTTRHYAHYRYLPELKEATDIWDAVLDSANLGDGFTVKLLAVG